MAVRKFRTRIPSWSISASGNSSGLDAQRQALEHGVRVTGCTVHFVNEQLDVGPIILQRAVEVRDDDTVEALSARILEQEHRAYVEAVERIVTARHSNTLAA